jgi:hypothetical protein
VNLRIRTRRSRWLPYVRQLADVLCLKDWRIEVFDEAPADQTAVASCCPVDGRKYGVIRLSEGFLNDGPTEQRHTLTHELLHCHLGPMMRVIEAQHDGLAPAVRLAMEYCVDGLADAIAPLLPPPPPSTRSQH